MFTLRCTKKLLDRMRVEPDPSPPEPTTVLGNWYANLVRYGRLQVILAVSEKTLLPVLLPAVDAKVLPQRLPEYLFDVLKRLDVPLASIDQELRAMQEVGIAKTANRKVLGTLNDFAFMASDALEDGESLVATALWLAETPCGAMKYGFPDKLTVEAFRGSLH